jgi:phosphatidylglycerophosphatase A
MALNISCKLPVTTNQKLKYLAIEWIQSRGVSLEDIARLVYEIQKSYIPNLSLEDCFCSVDRVMDKREVQNSIFTGISLDELTEKGLIREPLRTMVQNDDGLYGIDEIMALSIVNVYGSIGLTNFGYLDKVKPCIMGELNKHRDGIVNTFLDDIVAAIAAAAAARLAHQTRDQAENLA